MRQMNQQMLQQSVSRTLTTEQKDQMMELAGQVAWENKERAMRAQFEQLIASVKDGKHVSTMFAPVFEEDVATVYNALVTVADAFTMQERSDERRRRVQAVLAESKARVEQADALRRRARANADLADGFR